MSESIDASSWITVSGKATVSDTLRAYRHYLRKPFIFLTVVAGLWVVLGATADVSKERLIAFGVAAACIALPPVIMLVLWASFRRTPLAYGPCTLRFTDDGVHFKNEFVDQHAAWTTWRKFEESKTDFILTAGAVLTAYPKRFFAHDRDLNAVRELLATKVRSANSH